MKNTTNTNTNNKEDKILEKFNKDLNKDFVELKVLSTIFRNKVFLFKSKTKIFHYICDSLILNHSDEELEMSGYKEFIVSLPLVEVIDEIYYSHEKVDDLVDDHLSYYDEDLYDRVHKSYQLKLDDNTSL